MKTSKKCLHIYLADHDWDKTSSKGIYHFSQCWLRQFVKEDPGDWQVVISVLSTNEKRIIPENVSDCVRIKRVGGPRIWLDQIWAPWFNFRIKADVVLYMKGNLPLMSWGRERRVAVVFDSILEYYRVHYPGYFSRLKIFYFVSMKRFTLRRADKLLCISEFSKSELLRIYGLHREIEVIPLGDSLPAAAIPGAETRKGILVFASGFPHKRSAEALRLVLAWKSTNDRDEPVIAVGHLPEGSELRDQVLLCEGLDDEALSRQLSKVRAVILLSEIEGFGLPILEAYARGTPVVYRDGHAFSEILSAQPKGRWDGQSDLSFFKALDEVLDMEETEIASTREALLREHNWEKCVQRSMAQIEQAYRSAG